MALDGWLRLELRYLAALKAIAATGSFNGAASQLGYTQSTISHQIAALERIVGQTCVDREKGRRSVTLTPAGSLLLEHADAILSRSQRARAGLEKLAQGAAGTLRVGTYQGAGVRLLPRAVAHLARTHPAIEVEIHLDQDDLALVERVLDGDLDLTFCVRPVTPGPLEIEDVFEDQWLLLVPADSKLVGASVDLESLASLPLIGHRGCRSEERLDSYLRGLGINLQRVAYAADNAIVQGLVAEGRGMALMTDLSIDPADARTRIVGLADPVPARKVALVWRRDQHLIPAVQEFVAAARSVTVTSHRNGSRSL